MEKTLKEFIPEELIAQVVGSLDVKIEDIEEDTRCLKNKNTLFVALLGIQVNGEKFIDDAIEKGAVAILVNKDFNWKKFQNPPVTFVKIVDLKKNFHKIVCNFYDHPSNKLKIVAVTGTCGKTSVSFLGQQLFNSLGKKSGLISTVQIDDGQNIEKAKMTTPGVTILQRTFYQMLQNGLEYCFTEASSHALDQDRLKGTKIFAAIFTNISNNEHLDYHKTFDNYLSAKKKLADNLDSNALLIFNADDYFVEKLVQDSRAKKFSYGFSSNVDFTCLFQNKIEGLEFSFDDGQNFIKTPLLGLGNVYNVLAVTLLAKTVGLTNFEEGIKSLKPIIGRYQIYNYKGVNVIVDFAHKVGAFESIFHDVQIWKKGKVVTVFGCGGCRDKTKRPLMTHSACRYSDLVVITTDNIRTENFRDIVKDMISTLLEEFFRKVVIMFDRQEAIKFAMQNAHEGDCVLILGKGHESEQIIGIKVSHLSDIEFVENLIKDA